MSDGAPSFPSLRLYTPRPRSRSDWNEIRARIDLKKLAAALLGPPVERRGLRSGSLGWYCPFEEGPSPSFRVILGETSWSCSSCGAGGDAAALVMRLKSMAFRDAIAWLDEQAGLDHSSRVAGDDRGTPWAQAARVWQQDPSAIGERPDIMDGAQHLERLPGARPE
jgi:DNA primase